MLLGVDLKDVQQVFLVRPPNLEHSLVQAMGRAGRMSVAGTRSRTLLYILYNAQVCSLDDLFFKEIALFAA